MLGFRKTGGTNGGFIDKLSDSCVASVGWNGLGIAMAITQDHSTLPAHAHLNLLGWVSLFLFGLYYKFTPTIDQSRIAYVQVMTWIIGTVVLTIGVGLVHSGNAAGDPIAAIGSLTVLGSMALFGWIVLRRDSYAKSPGAMASPTE